MPRQRRDIFLVATQDAEVFHSAQIEDSGRLIPSTGGQYITPTRLEERFGNCALMAVERCQAPGSSWIPQLH